MWAKKTQHTRAGMLKTYKEELTAGWEQDSFRKKFTAFKPWNLCAFNQFHFLS